MEALEIHDYIQLKLSNGYVLSIYNNYFISLDSLSSFIGVAVKEIDLFEDRVVIIFGNDALLNIGLNDDDYNGPEALMLTTANNEFFIYP